MEQKTSIRFFNDIPVRSVWSDSKWWLCAVDVIEALSLSSSPRVYWATIKRRNSQLIAFCKQLKLTAKLENCSLARLPIGLTIENFL